MKYVNLFILIITLSLTSTVNGQSQMAVFLHGFEGGADSWPSAGTPDEWVAAGIIDAYINFVYTSDELKNQNTQGDLIERLATQMLTKPENTEWVIVGHSMGGLIARLGYHALKLSYPDLNIKAILTVGTPHQGARAAAVAAPGLCGEVTTLPPGYTNVGPVLDEFRVDVLEPFGHVHSTANLFIKWFFPSALSQLNSVPDVLEDGYCELKEWEQASILNNVNESIGINGTVIQTINSPEIFQPELKRSIIGAEKRFIPVRAASELLGTDENNERRIVSNYDSIRRYYRVQRDAWNATYIASAFMCGNCRRNRNRWARGRAALDNIDTTWGLIIDSFFSYSTGEIGMWEPIGYCNQEEFDPGTRNLSEKHDIPEGHEVCIGGILYRWVIRTHIVTFATKNDVLIGPQYAVWSTGQNPNDRSINWYYNDIPDDGGYNHFELRRYKRAYTLPGVFQQGQLAPPMREAAIWVDEEVFRRD